MREAIEFADQFSSASARPSGGNRGLFRAILRLTPLIGTLLLLAGGSLYLHTQKADLVKELILEVDRFGITSIGQEEQNRRTLINAMPITYEEKQVLINRTVFLGASEEMVTLALGMPKEQQPAPAENGQQAGTVYLYHFAKDSRPTLLRFENNKLTHAYKASTIDVAGN